MALQIGSVVVRLDGVTGYRIEEASEEGPRLGNMIMLNLFVGATVAFLLGILTDHLTSRFYLAVALFSLLSLAALDDVLRSRGLVLFKLFVLRAGAEKLDFVTPDVRLMRAVAAEFDRRQVPRIG